MTPLETIEALSTDRISVIASDSDKAGCSEVRESAGYRWLTNGGNSVQSLMSIDSPAALLLPNHVAMLFGLLLIEEVDNVLSLGMGGASLERFLHNQYPECRISSVEPNERIIEFAHDFFGVPAKVQVALSNADSFLKSTTERFSLILCDIFDQEKHPACLTQKSFYQDIESKLHSNGVLALNSTPTSNEDMLRILEALRSSFSVVYLATVGDRGNIVVVAKNGQTPTDSIIRLRADIISARVDLPLAQWVDEFRLVPQAG